MNLLTSSSDSSRSEEASSVESEVDSGSRASQITNETESRSITQRSVQHQSEKVSAGHAGGLTAESSESSQAFLRQNRSKPLIRREPKAKADRNKSKLLRDQDLPLKLEIANALATSGYYTRINVSLSAISNRGLADVTDIDVLGLKYDVTFNPEAIAVSCKSGTSRGLSPAREVFYVRGVLDYVRAGTGVAAFLNKPVAAHLRDLGRRLNVLVLSGSEIQSWCESLTNGLPDSGYFEESTFEKYLSLWSNHVNTELLAYLRTDYWFHMDFRNLQNLVGHLRRLSAKIREHQEWIHIVVLDAAAHLCLTLFDLCYQIRMTGVSTIGETTRAYLFGGTVSFKARKDLYLRVQQLLASTGVLRDDGPGLPPLEPAYTSTLSELAIRFLERPHAAITVPQVIQDSIWRRLGARGMPQREDTNSLAAEKLAQDLNDFVGIATGAKWRIKL